MSAKHGSETNWLWVGVAFVVGLAVGLGLFAWQYTTTERKIAVSKARLESDVASLTANNQRLTSAVRVAEASATALQAQVASLTKPAAAAGGNDTSGDETPTGPIEITERAGDPSTVKGGGTLDLVVKLKGKAAKVSMRVARGTSYDKTYFLARTDDTDGVQTWKRSITAPSTKGDYRLYAVATGGDGKKYSTPGGPDWIITVE